MSNRSMRLLFVAHYFPLNGPDVFRACDFARFLMYFHCDVTVVSRMGIDDVFHVKAVQNINGVKIFRALTLDLRLAVMILDLIQIVSTFLLSFVVIFLNKISVVIISVPPGVPGIGAFFASKLLFKRVVFDVRDKWEDYSIFSSKYRIVRFTHRRLKELFTVFYRSADLVVGVTPSLVNHLRARGAFKTALIPNGVDLNLFHPIEKNERFDLRSKLGFGKEDIVLVYTGGIGGYYRPDIVLQAMYNVSQEKHIDKFKFLLIGGGEKTEIKKILGLVRSLNYRNRVVLLGKRSMEEVANILPACDLGVVPYDDNPLWTYPQPTKFFEYCASELPSIASVEENSDLGRLVKKHKIGYVVKPLDVVQFESALKDFCQKSEAARKEMGTKARIMVKSSFDRQRLAQLLLENLQSLRND